MKKVNQLKVGSILSYIQMGLNIIIELLFTQLMIKALGKSEYGLYNTVASTISMLSILSLGFNSSYVRYFAKYKVKNDETNISKLNGMFLLVFIFIGCIALLCGIYLSFNLKFIFKDGLSVSEYELARILMLLLTLSLSFSFPMSVFGNIISANERFVFLKITNMIKTILGPLLSMPLLLLGFRSVSFVVVTLVISILADILNLIYCVRIIKTKFIFHHLDKDVFKDLFVYTSFIAINIIVDQINSNVDNIMLARFKGTKEVAVYAVGSRLYTAYVRFSSSVSGVFTPRIHKIVNSIKNPEKLRVELTELFIKVGRIQFYILSLVATGIIFFGKTFIRYWAGDGFNNSYYVALLLIIPGTIPLIQNLGIEIQRALNKHQFRSIAYLFMAIINLSISYYLCQIYGAVGSTIGTAFSLIIANGIIMNIFYYKKCYIDVISFWVNIFKASVGLIIPVIIGVLLTKIINISIYIYLLCIVFYTTIFLVSMYFFSMNRYEKDLVVGVLKKLIKVRG